jgi:hypothetical protein
MDIVEILRSTDSAAQILATLSVYAENLRNVAAIPDWCSTPLNSEADIQERMAALFVAINLTSQHRLDHDCDNAKRALHVFATGLQRLNPRISAN